jgi:hypothetical protein
MVFTQLQAESWGQSLPNTNQSTTNMTTSIDASSSSSSSSPPASWQETTHNMIKPTQNMTSIKFPSTPLAFATTTTNNNNNNNNNHNTGSSPSLLSAGSSRPRRYVISRWDELFYELFLAPIYEFILNMFSYITYSFRVIRAMSQYLYGQWMARIMRLPVRAEAYGQTTSILSRTVRTYLLAWFTPVVSQRLVNSIHSMSMFLHHALAEDSTTITTTHCLNAYLYTLMILDGTLDEYLALIHQSLSMKLHNTSVTGENYVRFKVKSNQFLPIEVIAIRKAIKEAEMNVPEKIHAAVAAKLAEMTPV